jgi:Predicted periplasmic lipoprotein (DUF2279)
MYQNLYFFAKKIIIIACFALFFSTFVTAQEQKKLPLLSFQAADSLHKKRVWAMAGIGTACYTGMFTLLNQAWYAGYARSSFHFFDDNGEWEQMDKAGHVFGGYFESRWFSSAFQWAGVKQRNAAYIGFGSGMLIQGTLEVFDGFSSKWGFSKGDILANTTGASLFLAQEMIWKEQRLMMKVSNFPVRYPTTTILSDDQKYSTTLQQKAYNLYGSNYIVTFLKDYNAQTLWLSGNLHSFFPNSTIPKWLNLAVGYGAQNMYVGDNKYSWTQEKTQNGIPAGTTFSINPNDYPRYRQYYLSLDVDLTKIKSKNHFIRTLLHGFNILKIPSPTLELNSLGKVKFYPLYF